MSEEQLGIDIVNDMAILGEDVTLKTITSTTRNEYGDRTPSTSESTIKAIPRPINGKDLEYLQAGARVGYDSVVMFDKNATVNIGDKVVIDGQTMTVRQSKLLRVGGSLAATECFCKKEGN